LEYENGNLIRAVTRGDGFVGEDITANAQKFYDVPQSGVKLNGKLFTGFVRGEIILTNKLWAEADPDMLKNPRNLGNGICRRKNGENSDLLTIFAFRAHTPTGEEIADTEAEGMLLLQKMGFTVAKSLTGTADEVWEFFTSTLAIRATLPYWIDGIVVKVDNLLLQQEMGIRDNRPKGQIAIKFPAQGVTSTLLGIVLTVGHTGAIIPTGQFTPVEIGGTTVANALLCNWDVINDLDIAIHDEVTLYKAGDIIPKVLKVTARPENRILIPVPTHCPVCNEALSTKTNHEGRVSSSLFCLNVTCPAKISGKLSHYITSLNILGIGDSVLDTLIQKMELTSLADIYLLHRRKEELAALKMGSKGITLGEKRASKILSEIEAKTKLTIPELIGSLGIEGLGKRRVELVQQALPGEFDTVLDWTTGKLNVLAAQVGLPNTGARISADLEANKTLIDQLHANGVSIIASAPKAVVKEGALRICITGALSQPRNYYTKLLEDKGHVFKDDVNKEVDYLVMADPSSGSSKAKKAAKLGIPCINEDKLLELLA